MEDFLFKDMWFYNPMIVFGGFSIEKVKEDLMERSQMLAVSVITDKSHQLYKDCNASTPPNVKDDIAGVIICCSYNKFFEA